MSKPAIEIKNVNRSWCVVSGAAVLSKFRTEDAAIESLNSDREIYEFCAGSAGVSI